MNAIVLDLDYQVKTYKDPISDPNISDYICMDQIQISCGGFYPFFEPAAWDTRIKAWHMEYS